MVPYNCNPNLTAGADPWANQPSLLSELWPSKRPCQKKRSQVSFLYCRNAPQASSCMALSNTCMHHIPHRGCYEADSNPWTRSGRWGSDFIKQPGAAGVRRNWNPGPSQGTSLSLRKRCHTVLTICQNTLQDIPDPKLWWAASHRDQDYLLTHTSNPPCKPDPHARTLRVDLEAGPKASSYS